jgi:hypothetical protein
MSEEDGMGGSCLSGCRSWVFVSIVSFCSVWRIRVSSSKSLSCDPSLLTLRICSDFEDAPSGIGLCLAIGPLQTLKHVDFSGVFTCFSTRG